MKYKGPSPQSIFPSTMKPFKRPPPFEPKFAPDAPSRKIDTAVPKSQIKKTISRRIRPTLTLGDISLANVGARLRLVRKQANLSQYDVALHFNITRQAVGNWEQGQSLPNGTLLAKLATIYGTSTDFILFGSRTVPVSEALIALPGMLGNV